jgi:hypothetical protein
MRRTASAILIILATLSAGGLVESIAQPSAPSVAPATGVASVDSTRADTTLDLAAARRKLPRYMQAVTATLDPRLQGAIARIRAGERRWLAVRGYVRREQKVHTHWSWTAREAAEFRKTAEYRAMIDTIAEVRRRFAALNPGYRLEVITDIRTLETQIGKWNTVGSIAVAGREVVDTSLVILADSSYAEIPDSAGTARFRAFLDGYELVTTPTVAVPGFSDHGQLRAFDFKVYRGGRLIAGTTTATIAKTWDSPGWSCRLNQAICGYGDVFLGPLQEPYEPWHYTWVGWRLGR